LSEEWYARPVLFVADIDRTLDFYVNRMAFTQSWRYEEDGKAFVAQADRQGCSLIFSSQWLEKVGKGLMFISLNVDAPPDKLIAEEARALDRLRAEFEGRASMWRTGGGDTGYWSFVIPTETSSISTIQLPAKSRL
jgi:catechol 2,3-dioxygenase-like lactoylglutathione lyase family enzyme